MVKAAAGGGGRGMRIVRDARRAGRRRWRAARREALRRLRRRRAPGRALRRARPPRRGPDPRRRARQRRPPRRARVQPPAPPPEGRRGGALAGRSTAALRERIGAAAVALARAAGYVGAGTVEFLVDRRRPERVLLPRGQRAPAGRAPGDRDGHRPRPRRAAAARRRRRAARASRQEDVALRRPRDRGRASAPRTRRATSCPRPGELVGYREPRGTGRPRRQRRRAGQPRSRPFYDSLLLKVIAHGADREAAIERLDRALGELRLLGLPTNGGFLRRLIELDSGPRGEMDTGLIDRRRGRDAAAGSEAARSDGRLRRVPERRAARRRGRRSLEHPGRLPTERARPADARSWPRGAAIRCRSRSRGSR